MLSILLTVFSAALRVFSLWFALVALFALRRPKPVERRAPQLRFACVIAARNEEAVIGALVESLRAQNYPAALRDVYVIPNNCTDRTAECAAAAGARLLHCLHPVTRKGDALHEAVAQLLPRGYDAFCVFDADNIADPDFLARMNDVLLAGAPLAKGALRAKNPYDSATAGCYGLYFTLFDTFFSRARANCGLSAKLVGTGFAVHRRVFEALGGWNTVTLAEDAEFSAQCAAAGFRVAWVPEAVTYDESPVSFAVSLRQRRRWCSGIMDVAQRRAPSLLRAIPGAGGLRAFDSLMIVCAPFAQAVGALPTALTLAIQPETALLLPVAAAAMFLFALVLARIGGYCNGRIVRAAALFPLFMAAFLPLNLISLLRRKREWKPIAHTRALRLQQLQP